jgi:YD repeat-containing protein
LNQIFRAIVLKAIPGLAVLITDVLRKAAPAIRQGLAVLATLSFASSAAAQTTPSGLPTSVEVRAPDENGVDMYSGSIKFSIQDVSIGGMTHVVTSLNPPDHTGSPLAFNRLTGLMDNYQAVVVIRPPCPSCMPIFTIGTGASSEQFTINSSNGNFTTGTGGGTVISDPSANCTAAASCGYWIYINTSGTAVSITNVSGVPAMVTKVVHPDGLVERVVHATSFRDIGTYSYTNSPASAVPYQTGYPVLSVNRSDGLQLKYQYGPNWDLQGVVAVNNAYEYCDPSAVACTTSQTWPTSSYTWGSSSAGTDTVLTVGDSGGRTTRYTLDNFGRVRSVRPPSSANDLYFFDYCLRRFQYNPYAYGIRDPHSCFYYWDTYLLGTSIVYIEDRVLSATRDGQNWSYGYPVEGSTILASQTLTMFPLIAARPDGNLTTANETIDTPSFLVNFSAPGVYATFEQDLANKVSSAYSWSRGGVSYSYTYDSRANILSDGHVSAGYDAVCQNPKTCNQPNWIRDAMGNETDYVYDPQHGGALSITSPADSNGIRPQTRFAYVQRYAWFLNASGQMVRSTDPVWKLASQSICRSGAAAGAGCATPGDETLTTYDYGPDSGPNNLWLRGEVVTAGGVSRRTCYTYDRRGNRISATSPRAGLTSCP